MVTLIRRIKSRETAVELLHTFLLTVWRVSNCRGLRISEERLTKHSNGSIEPIDIAIRAHSN